MQGELQPSGFPTSRGQKRPRPRGIPDIPSPRGIPAPSQGDPGIPDSVGSLHPARGIRGSLPAARRDQGDPCTQPGGIRHPRTVGSRCTGPGPQPVRRPPGIVPFPPRGSRSGGAAPRDRHPSRRAPRHGESPSPVAPPPPCPPAAQGRGQGRRRRHGHPPAPRMASPAAPGGDAGPLAWRRAAPLRAPPPRGTHWRWARAERSVIGRQCRRSGRGAWRAGAAAAPFIHSPARGSGAPGRRRWPWRCTGRPGGTAPSRAAAPLPSQPARNQRAGRGAPWAGARPAAGAMRAAGCRGSR